MQRLDDAEALVSPTRPLWSRVWNTLVITWVVWDRKRKVLAVLAFALAAIAIVVVVISVAMSAKPVASVTNQTSTIPATTSNKTMTATPKPNQTTPAETTTSHIASQGLLYLWKMLDWLLGMLRVPLADDHKDNGSKKIAEKAKCEFQST